MHGMHGTGHLETLPILKASEEKAIYILYLDAIDTLDSI